MNAFLIFCKWQRGCVRRKYSFLENWELRRVLGEWWVSLGEISKSLYSALAYQQHKENLIKPHSRIKWLRMPGGKTRKPQIDLSQPGIVPGKLADESQLGGLSSLLQLTKEPIPEVKPPLPKPLKKRYRDEVYDNTEPSVQSPPVVPEQKKEKNGENSKSLIETSEEEEERLKVWRSHILEENVNTKRTRARACKGQRYREFMWTSYANRRRSNRWELNQDKEETTSAKKIKTANKTEKSQNKSSKTTKTVNGTMTPSVAEKSDDLINESHSDHSEKSEDALSIHMPEEAPLNKKRKRKLTKSKSSSPSATINVNPTKDNNDNLMATDSEDNIDFNQNNDNEIEMKNNYSGFVLLAPNNNTISSNNHNAIKNNKNVSLQEENRKLDSGIVGSRKRKARRQEIRRLAPGSTFKGVDVIAENDLRKDN